MEKTIKKWFWVWEFDKEEQWLNTMAQSGWVLTKVGFASYTFAPCEPGAYTVRLEMHERDEAYLAFMEETGAEYIGRMTQWVYFRKKTELGDFNLFSDLDSRMNHLSRISRVLTSVGLVNLGLGVLNSINPIVHLGWINLLAATLLMYGLGRIHGKMEAMNRERLLTE